ncbi:MAG: DUF362 domain-containing protein [Clostridia bacterium]|nr:DUF362 domain-containing protein [Clostridia bacterium]
MRNTVSVTGCNSYDPEEVRPALEAVLKPLGGLDFVKAGMTIVIKANLVSMLKPASAATTHPVLLTELCRMLVAKGAKVIVGDSPGGLYTAAYVNAVYAATGVKAVTEAGAELNHDFTHAHADNPRGHTLKELEYTKYLDGADAIINFCKLKTHGMMGMSACVKNMFGAIPGTFKPEYHYKYPKHAQFADMLVDINERFKPRLCLVDAVYGMEGNGPTMGTPRFIGAILASDSPYCCDRVCAGIIGLDPEEVDTIAAAKARGLENGFDIVGDPEKFRVTDYRLVRDRKDMSFNRELPGIFGKWFGSFVSGALASRPRPDKKQCVGCEKCFRLCPAKAITMKNRKPSINKKACIRCFCCQEFCPKGAMKLHRPLIARFLNR